MNNSKKWINLQDISIWKDFSYDTMTMYNGLHGIQTAFINTNVPLDDRIHLLCRSELFNPLQENDEHLVLDGELVLEDISWISHMKILTFYKRYIVHNEYQKVVVGYESRFEHWIKEETIKNENYMFETHHRFNETDLVNSLPSVIPNDW